MVTNGVYATGGRAVYTATTNRVAVDKPLVLRSVKGPEATIIQGEQAPACGCSNTAIRCVYLTNDAVLSGFTLTNGAAPSGGGVFCESASALVTNCVLAGNVASWSGGGSFRGTLTHCVEPLLEAPLSVRNHPAVQVRRDAAHGVVGRGLDRHRLRLRLDAKVGAGEVGDVRQLGVDHLRREPART